MQDEAERKDQLFALMRRMVQLGTLLPKKPIHEIDPTEPVVSMVIDEMLKTSDAVDALIGRKR
jgi:hypothetical protein